MTTTRVSSESSRATVSAANMAVPDEPPTRMPSCRVWVRVSDRDSLLTARAITRQEGILVGGSSGTAMFAALTVARELPGDTLVVVIFPDTGRNYLSKVYSESWMLQYGFLEREEAVRVEEVLSAKHGEIPPLVSVGAHEKIRQAVDRLQKFGISQATVAPDTEIETLSLLGSLPDPIAS